ncbi:hypothetical protein [Bartonella sp. B41]
MDKIIADGCMYENLFRGSFLANLFVEEIMKLALLIIPRITLFFGREIGDIKYISYGTVAI